jgi:hypothetical protein
VLILGLLLTTQWCFAQFTVTRDDFFARFSDGTAMPEKLLDGRSAVIYNYRYTQKELTTAQESFQNTGVDAVAYFDLDLLLAGKDMARALATYFNRREVVNLVFLDKSEGLYTVFMLSFNGKDSFVEENQPAWKSSDPNLAELLKKIYRTAANSLTRRNLLINSHPETDLPVNVIAGRRSEFFAIDLKVDPIAVPKTGDEEIDRQLAEIFAHYPYKYKLTEPGLSERELRTQGFLYVLSFVHTRGSVARELLGFEPSPKETAYVSVCYAAPNSPVELKTIPAETQIFKFYCKHIESGNVFLGTKWDADVTWQQAITNHLMAFRSELRIN